MLPIPTILFFVNLKFIPNFINQRLEQLVAGTKAGVVLFSFGTLVKASQMPMWTLDTILRAMDQVKTIETTF
jgi:hypothetical protein